MVISCVKTWKMGSLKRKRNRAHTVSARDSGYCLQLSPWASDPDQMFIDAVIV
jgi:hypothetical protein